ncbi:glutathione S-transferase [Stagnimonas aquatica]|uniref:Glutathione S-transferase n=1 Tax=Stagnimonas aquatica TaxID=2689987 RepID=A0A3N0V134_9GAMM|nr:glutathione S-transferase N-terminal domain-containing protein [Stagnimonas aquatica]ROH86507.1 glutathione S-transferase [Stagnimonas aquatica]
MTLEPYRLIGANPSPYSRKLRAILRYRRLPHLWKVGSADTLPEVAHVRPKLVPMLRAPEESEWRVDSTPLAYWLEERHPGERSIIPDDPAQAFLCHLIEDFADEWVSKQMFHYRWFEDATALWAAQWIVRDSLPKAHGPALTQAAKFFHDRQRSRMAMVGCTPANAPLIEASYQRLLDLLGPAVSASRFLFGSRPSLADFALYGQLAQLSLDPWPQRVCRERAPAVEAWVITLDDAAGIDGEWKPELLASTRAGLLEMIGAEYLPFLSANQQALAAGRSELVANIRGQEFRQAPFGYQEKCRAELLRRWALLPAESRQALRPVLEAAACVDWFERQSEG